MEKKSDEAEPAPVADQYMEAADEAEDSLVADSLPAFDGMDGQPYVPMMDFQVFGSDSPDPVERAGMDTRLAKAVLPRGASRLEEWDNAASAIEISDSPCKELLPNDVAMMNPYEKLAFYNDLHQKAKELLASYDGYL